MNSKRNGIPDGFHTATPYVIVKDADSALTFYQKAFGAAEFSRFVDNEGRVRNLEVMIGDSPVMIGIHPEIGETEDQPVGSLPRLSVYLYVEDADSVFRQAVDAGATPLYAPQDQDYGNREGGIKDPFGVTWWIATSLHHT